MKTIAAALLAVTISVPAFAAKEKVLLPLSFNGEVAGRLWAFVSVTNNETQHITTITPH